MGQVLCRSTSRSALSWSGVPRGLSIRQGSVLGPAGHLVLCPGLGSGSVSEAVVTAARLHCWVPHRPQEGWL